MSKFLTRLAAELTTFALFPHSVQHLHTTSLSTTPSHFKMPSKKGKSKSNSRANSAGNPNSTQNAADLPNGAPTIPDEAAAPQAPPSDETVESKSLQGGEEPREEQTQGQNHEHKDEGSSEQSQVEEQEEQNDVPVDERIRILEDDLETTRQEKEALGNQYRSLLGKLTAMRTTLGDKLKEDAVGYLFTLFLSAVCGN